MQVLVVVNDGPYAGERAYNALRTATALQNAGAGVRLFLMGDGAWCAAPPAAPEGVGYDMEWLMRRFLAGEQETAVCRTCMDARGIAEAQLMAGAKRGSLEELTRWTLESERALVF